MTFGLTFLSPSRKQGSSCKVIGLRSNSSTGSCDLDITGSSAVCPWLKIDFYVPNENAGRIYCAVVES